MAETLNITLEQGSTFIKDFQVIDASTGNPRNLTGYVIASELRTTHAAASASAALTGSLLVAVSGSFRLEMPYAQTAALAAGVYVYDVELTSPSDVRERLVEGEITVSPEATKS